MTSIFDKESQMRYALDLTILALVIIMTFVIGMVVHRLAKYHKHTVTESGVMLLIGLGFGFFRWLVSGSDVEKSVFERFDRHLFEFILLPAIIFASGFELKKAGLFRHLFSILSFAFLGTVLSTLVIGFSIYGLAALGLPSVENMMEALVFASIVSAIDPVATLAILGDVFQIQKSKEVPKLYTLVFGESVINDAVAIVLYRIFVANLNHDFTVMNSLWMCFTFVYVVLGSIAVGSLFGFASSLFFKFINFRNHTVAEFIILIMFSFLSYFVATLFTFSGIMSLFICAIIIGRYTYYNLTELSQITAPQTIRYGSILAETYVFLYLGFSLFDWMKIDSWRFGFIAVALVLCIVARALHIFPLSLIANITKKEKISFKEQIVLWFSGLRGAIAFVLALELMDVDTPSNNIIVTTTLSIVLITTFVVGSGTYPLLAILKLVKHDATAGPSQPSIILTYDSKFHEKDDAPKNPVFHRKLDSILLRIDENILKPLFRKRNDVKSKRVRNLILNDSIKYMKFAEVDMDEHDELKSSAFQKAPRYQWNDFIKGVRGIFRGYKIKKSEPIVDEEMDLQSSPDSEPVDIENDAEETFQEDNTESEKKENDISTDLLEEDLQV